MIPRSGSGGPNLNPGREDEVFAEQGKQKFTCVGACRKRTLTTFTKQIGVPPRASLETGTFPDLGLHGPLVGGNGDLNTTEIPSPPTGDLS